MVSSFGFYTNERIIISSLPYFQRTFQELYLQRFRFPGISQQPPRNGSRSDGRHGGFRGKREGAPCGAPSRCASGYGSAPCGRDALSSHGLNRSTFGDEGLNCRVRDGFGWDPLSMVAPAGGGPHAEGIPLSSAPWGPHGAPSRGLRKIRSVSRSSVIR